MKLYFCDSNNQERIIAEVSNDVEAMQQINKFLDEHNYKSYYTRIWVEPNGDKWFDVGSHTEFFILKDN